MAALLAAHKVPLLIPPAGLQHAEPAGSSAA